MQQPVAAVGQRVDHREQARNADRQPGIERDLGLGHRAQPPVDAGVGADQLDLEAGHAALADLGERAGDAVDRAEAVGHQRHADRLAVGTRGHGRRSRSRARNAAAGAYGSAATHASKTPAATRSSPRPSSLTCATAAASLRSWQRRARRSRRRARTRRPAGGRAATRPSVSSSTASSHARSTARASRGPRSPPSGPSARPRPSIRSIIRMHRGRVGRRAVVVIAPERADGERHRRVRPLGGRALVAEGADAAGADVGEELLRRGGARGLGPRAADVDARVVVGAADPDAAVGVDVDRRRQVQLARAGAVADLPDREQLGEPAPVARGQRRLDGVERVRERARDLVLVQVGGDGLDVAGVRLEPLVVAPA